MVFGNLPFPLVAWLGSALLMGACATAPRPMPLAESGPVEVSQAGASYIADLQPGPVLTISRDPAMGYAEGKLAKDVAQQFCTSRGRRLDPRAFGHFTGAGWQFKGACA